MDARERLRALLEDRPVDRLPRLEADFDDETVETWREQGHTIRRTPFQHFELDRLYEAPLHCRRMVPEGQPQPVAGEVLDSFDALYDPNAPGRFPDEWPQRVSQLAQRTHVLFATAYAEGLFQVLGVRDWETLCEALYFLVDRPGDAECFLARYAEFVARMIADHIAPLDVDYLYYNEPIAHNTGPVVSPELYRRFALPVLRRVVQAGRAAGIREHVLRTSGDIRAMIPIWLEAGITGLHLTQTAAAGIDCLAVRAAYGRRLALWGGINWRVLLEGETAIDHELEHVVAPLRDSGRYLPHLDDTIRPNLPFERYAYYRKRLNAMAARG